MQETLKNEIMDYRAEIERLKELVEKETQFIQSEIEVHLVTRGIFYLRDNIEDWFIRRDMFAERLEFAEQVLWKLEWILKKGMEV